MNNTSEHEPEMPTNGTRDTRMNTVRFVKKDPATPAGDSKPGTRTEIHPRWATELHPFEAADAGSLVPPNRQAILRILHPAQTLDPKDPENRHNVRWSEIAELAHKPLLPDTAFGELLKNIPEGTPKILGPDCGYMPESTGHALRGHLKDEGCFYHAFWEGFGDLPLHVTAATSILILPRRRFYVIALPEPQPDISFEEACSHLSCSRLWPATEEWVLATSIDMDSSYLACPEKLARRLRADQRLETLDITPNTRLC